MSAERFEKYYALTKHGWESTSKGASTDGFEDWVRLYEVKVYQGSAFGRTSEEWHILKGNSELSDAQADEIEAKFPKPVQKPTDSELAALIERIR